MWLRMLASSLLILTSTPFSVGEDCDSAELPKDSNVVTALGEVTCALHAFKDVFRDYLRDSKESYDNLGKVMSELKDEIRNLRGSDECDVAKVKKLSEEKRELKIQLADRDRKVEELEQLLQSTKQQNEQGLSKIHKLEEFLESSRDENGQLTMKVHTLDTLLKHSGQRQEELLDQVAVLNNAVQDMEIKLNASLKQGEEMKEKEHFLSRTVSLRDKKLKEACELGKRPEVSEQVEGFSWTRDWEALRGGLEAVLSNKSTVYKQLQHEVHRDHPLFVMGQSGCIDLAVLLMCAGLPSDTADADGDNMLHGAASSSHVGTAATLLDLGANIEAHGAKGRSTPLIWAAYSDQPEMVMMLTERGAALNATNNEGDTALHIAAREGYLVVVKILVAAGADTTATGKDNYTAFVLAEIKGHTAMMTYLNDYPH